MEYPSDFVKKVKEVYPKFEKLHEALEKGSEFVGRYLDDSRGFSMSPEEIVEAFEQGHEQDVLTAAKSAVERNNLYSEWSDLYQAQR